MENTVESKLMANADFLKELSMPTPAGTLDDTGTGSFLFTKFSEYKSTVDIFVEVFEKVASEMHFDVDKGSVWQVYRIKSADAFYLMPSKPAKDWYEVKGARTGNDYRLDVHTMSLLVSYIALERVRDNYLQYFAYLIPPVTRYYTTLRHSVQRIAFKMLYECSQDYSADSQSEVDQLEDGFLDCIDCYNEKIDL